MKWSRMSWSRLSWAALGVIAVCGTETASAQGPRTTEREIQSMLDESAASWNRGDLDGHLADNADSISFMTRNGPIVGKRQDGRCAAAELLQGRQAGPAAPLRAGHHSPAGRGHALVVGRFILFGGGQAEQSGWFSTIWERQAAGWRVIHDHSS